MGELKPCPFCGGSALLRGFAVDEAMHWWVACENCGATSGELLAESTPDRDFAVESWNHRTHPQPVTPAGGEVVAYRYVADEGVYNPFVRGWLDGSPDRLDLDNIARHPGVRFEFAYSNPPVPDHELQQKWFRRGWDMYVELHGETHPPVADAALVRDAERYRWWRENIDLLDQHSMLGIAYSCQIPVHNGHVPTADLMDMIADSQDAALNQRGGGDHG